ncbi:MAG: hypothetical protein PWQ96_503 [Clostridia bacterium]|jgi:sirohydrochlorin ferrochelatase|nr:cobalamin [Clostridiales bacterium]MDK2984861.1 hypothetical protein [Clostridia bacterium]
MKEGVILLGHGSRREEANNLVRDICSILQERDSDKKYVSAFLEFGAPSLPDAAKDLIEEGAERIVVAPMFLTMGNHMHRDIPGKLLRLKTTHPDVRFAFAKHLGADPRIADIVMDRVTEASDLIE